MKRHVRRRLKRGWKKVKIFSVCTERVDLEVPFHTGCYEAVKIRDDVLVAYVLDRHMCWNIVICHVEDGFFWGLADFDGGVASDGWLARYFGDDDFEGF